MKRLISVCLLVCLIASCVPAFASVRSDLLTISNCNYWVSLRKTPDTASSRISTVPKGAFVTFDSIAENGFYHVKYGTEYGYILSQYLSPSNLAMQVENCNYYVTLRAQPSTKAKELMKVAKDEIVLYVSDAENGFFQVRYNGKIGYILSEYLFAADSESGHTKQVVDCNSWISLRSAPSTKATRLVKIPLNSEVISFGAYDSSMEYVYYDGKYGFALSKYLDDSEPYPFSVAPGNSIEKFSFEGEVSYAYLLEEGTIPVYDKPSSDGKRIGSIKDPNVFIVGENYSSSFNEYENSFSAVKWWNPSTNQMLKGYIKDSSLSKNEVSSATEWGNAAKGYIAVLNSNSKLLAGPKDNAIAIADLKKGSHLYLLGHIGTEWVYTSTYPFSTYVDDNKSIEEHSEGWIRLKNISIIDKW